MDKEPMFELMYCGQINWLTDGSVKTKTAYKQKKVHVLSCMNAFTSQQNDYHSKATHFMRLK